MSEDGRCSWLSCEQMCPRVGGHRGGMLACLPGELTVPVGVCQRSRPVGAGLMSLWRLRSATGCRPQAGHPGVRPSLRAGEDQCPGREHSTLLCSVHGRHTGGTACCTQSTNSNASLVQKHPHSHTPRNHVGPNIWAPGNAAKLTRRGWGGAGGSAGELGIWGLPSLAALKWQW